MVGGTGLYLRAALTELDLRPPPPPGLREPIAGRRRARRGRGRPCRAGRPGARGGQRVDSRDRQRVTRALELLEAGLEPPRAANACGPRTRAVPTALFGLVPDRAALDEAIDGRVAAMVAAGAREEVERARGGRLGHRPQGARVRRAAGRRRRRDDVPDPPLRRRQLTWMRKLAGVRLVDVTARAPADVAATVLDNLPA